MKASAIPSFLREKLRKDFPALSRKINGVDLAYLDNAASLLKIGPVLDRLMEFEKYSYSNVHRSVHQLGQEATEAYENVRPKLAKFLNIQDQSEIVFTKGTTESINLVAASLGESLVNEGDSVVVTRLEHHANFVPWQQLCFRRKAELMIVELTEDFSIDLSHFKEALKKKPKLVAFSAMSNVLGSIHPVSELSRLAKEVGAVVLVDGAQWSSHLPTDLSVWPHVDFYAFSAHKLGAPNGVGVLWGKKALLNKMPPYQFGGDMILEVQDRHTQFNEVPFKFEAGTPNISGVVGLGFALDYLQQLNISELAKLEKEICNDALSKILELDFVRLLGSTSSENRGPIFSFTLEGVHPHDLGTFLDQKGIAVRAGHHCCQPLHFHHHLVATTRASFSFYNDFHEVDRLIEGLKEARDFFKR